MISTLSVIIVLTFISALFSIPIICAKHAPIESIIPRPDIRRFTRMKPTQQRDYLIKKYLRTDEIRQLARGGWTIAFKGFKPNMTCMNNFEYREGKTYTCKGEPVLCVNGFHACLKPRDVCFYYCQPNDVYHIVFLQGVVPSDHSCYDGHSKVCAKMIKIGPRIDHRYITE